MEATGLSVGKSVLHGALGYAKSALAEEVALHLGVRRDQAFITDELEMMQGFLMTAHDEQDDNKVVRIWVKKVRDVAYNVEGCLQDFSVRLDKQSWWRVPLSLLDRRRVAKEMKELRAKVEDVSHRNVRYNLINNPGSRSATPTSQSSIAGATMLGIQETMKQKTSKVDLIQLINKKDTDLRVIALLGKGADLGQTSIIWTVYENEEVKNNFTCRAWVRVMHPFNPEDFIQSLVEQFHTSVGVDVLLETKKKGQELADEFNGYVNGKKFLIVLNDLSRIEEWNRVKRCFPSNNKGSLIIVSTRQGEVASLCAGQESMVSELKQCSFDQNVYAFYEKGSQDGTDLTKAARSSSRNAITNGTYHSHSQGADWNRATSKSYSRAMTMVISLEESHIVGQDTEIKKISDLILDKAGQQLKVISVWGMGGLGKTTLARDVYQEISGKFEKRACVTIMRPFILEELFKSLVIQLDAETSEKKNVVGLLGSTKITSLPVISLSELTKELARLIEEKSSLIVLDDVSSAAEWDLIVQRFPKMAKGSRVLVTTREENIAKLCSVQKDYIYIN